MQEWRCERLTAREALPLPAATARRRVAFVCKSDPGGRLEPPHRGLTTRKDGFLMATPNATRSDDGSTVDQHEPLAPRSDAASVTRARLEDRA
jgi:hypothetical protein